MILSFSYLWQPIAICPNLFQYEQEMTSCLLLNFKSTILCNMTFVFAIVTCNCFLVPYKVLWIWPLRPERAIPLHWVPPWLYLPPKLGLPLLLHILNIIINTGSREVWSGSGFGSFFFIKLTVCLLSKQSPNQAVSA